MSKQCSNKHHQDRPSSHLSTIACRSKSIRSNGTTHLWLYELWLHLNSPRSRRGYSGPRHPFRRQFPLWLLRMFLHGHLHRNLRAFLPGCQQANRLKFHQASQVMCRQGCLHLSRRVCHLLRPPMYHHGYPLQYHRAFLRQCPV